MRRLLVLLLAPLALLVGMLVALAPPTSAKGATDVVVTGPGMARVHLGYGRSHEQVRFEDLTESTQIYGIFGDQFGDRPDLTDAELGPAYDLSWREGREETIVSRVYPFAEGGAWGYVPDGQQIYGVAAAGGWWHGGDELEQQLVALGAAALTAPTAPTRAPYDAVAVAADLLARGAWTWVHGTLAA